ncbi:MAG: glycosyltransferase family 4 protein [Sedimentisphaerales bacterium]
MNILMLNYEFPPIGGGAGKVHLNILREYSKQNDLNIDVLTSAPQPPNQIIKLYDNINIHKVGVHKKNLHFWRKIEILEWLVKAGVYYKKLIKSKKYDIVHSFFGFPTGWFCYKSRKKIPYIISLRGSDVPGKNLRFAFEYKLLGLAFKAIWKNASCLVACSEGLKQRALRFYPQVKIEVIPNGVDIEKFYPISENRTKKSDLIRLITVGRLSITKRVNILTDAVKILVGQGKNVKLLVVGGGSLKDSLEKTAARKNLSNYIEFRGIVDSEQMPQFYQNSDLYVSATMQEGMSNAMLEAMACGLPIITTPCEGVDELIKGNGVIVKKETAGGIAKAISELVMNTEKLESMSKAARKHAENFTWKSISQTYLNFYQKILS